MRISRESFSGVITIRADATCSLEGLLEYEFSVQRSGKSFDVRRNWSPEAEWEWNVSYGDIGRGVVVKVSVRRPKSYYQFSDGDDYAYAIYDVLPKMAILFGNA
jgi:hypothetical protein